MRPLAPFEIGFSWGTWAIPLLVSFIPDWEFVSIRIGPIEFTWRWNEDVVAEWKAWKARASSNPPEEVIDNDG